MPDNVKGDVEALVQAWNRAYVVYRQITTATSIEQVGTLLDSLDPIRAAQLQAGTAIRTKLGLPPAIAHPCA